MGCDASVKNPAVAPASAPQMDATITLQRISRRKVFFEVIATVLLRAPRSVGYTLRRFLPRPRDVKAVDRRDIDALEGRR